MSFSFRNVALDAIPYRLVGWGMRDARYTIVVLEALDMTAAPRQSPGVIEIRPCAGIPRDCVRTTMS